MQESKLTIASYGALQIFAIVLSQEAIYLPSGDQATGDQSTGQYLFSKFLANSS